MLLNHAPPRVAQRGHVQPISARQQRRPQTSATVVAARRLNRAAGILATSVLADSAVEHYRGSFKNKTMFTPLAVSALTLATSIHGTADLRPVAHRLRDATYLLAAATGLIGTGFHIYNVGKKVGGFSCGSAGLERRIERTRGLLPVAEVSSDETTTASGAKRT
jgi:hypothetical protein